MVIPAAVQIWRSSRLLVALLASAAAVSAFAAYDPSDLYGDATVSSWQRPVYPPELVAAKFEGTVVVRFVVDETGNVVKARALRSFDPRANASAVDAVRHWKFQPALAAGKPAASCLDVRLAFRLKDRNEKQLPLTPEGLHALPVSEPSVGEQPDPEYPDELSDVHLDGEVTLQLEIDARGQVS